MSGRVSVVMAVRALCDVSTVAPDSGRDSEQVGYALSDGLACLAQLARQSAAVDGLKAALARADDHLSDNGGEYAAYDVAGILNDIRYL